MAGEFPERRWSPLLGPVAGALAVCLGLTSVTTGLRANPLTGPVTPTISAPTPAFHLTDSQDRLLSGRLDPATEARSQANALYAGAMLSLDRLTGDHAQALAQLQRAAALDPHFPDSQVAIADLLVESGQVETAFTQLESARAANPGSADIESALASVQKMRGQTDEAQRLAREALLRDPTQLPAMRVILEIAGDQNDLAGGLIHIKDILQSGGSAVTAATWLALANLYVEVARGDAQPPSGEVMLRTLLPMYQQAAAKPPADVETLTLLADTYRDLGRRRDALRTLREAVALSPSNVDLMLRCADLEIDLGRPSDALADYAAAYALNPSLAGLRPTLGRLYLEQGQYAPALPLLQGALADTPDDPGVEVDLGIAWDGLGQRDEAQACFKSVFDSGTCPPEAYLRLAFFQLTAQKLKEAAETLAAAQARFPKSAKVRLYEAMERRYARDYAGALARLDEARALTTGPGGEAMEPDFYLESSLTMNLAGRRDLIETTLQEGLARFPDNADLLNELAYFWADQGRRLPEALTLSRRAAELAPDNGPIADTCGWVYFQLDRAADALPYLQDAALLTNNDPVVLQHLGDTYLKLDRRRDAIATWLRALEKDPGNRDLAARIDAAQAQATDAHLRSAPAK